MMPLMPMMPKTDARTVANWLALLESPKWQVLRRTVGKGNDDKRTIQHFSQGLLAHWIVGSEP